MDSFLTFIEMDGYGSFVWPSYLVCAALLGWLYLSSRQTRQKLEREFETLKAARPGRRSRDTESPT
ncbi:heme exporter protein CcmD [Rhodovibrionaceae bacterium A322]